MIAFLLDLIGGGVLESMEAVKSRGKLERMLYTVGQRQHFAYVEEAAFAYENDLLQVAKTAQALVCHL